jgi:hypothetical protein
MADPTEKRLLARINGDLKWRSKRFRLGRKTYDLVAMGELLANIRRRKGYRFKPALVPADPQDSDITDHGESSEEDEDAEEEEKVGDKYLDKLSSDDDEDDEDDEDADEDEDDDDDEIGDRYLIEDEKMDDESRLAEESRIAGELQRLKSLNGY